MAGREGGGEAKGCETVCMCMCARVDAGKREGSSEICNVLLH